MDRSIRIEGVHSTYLDPSFCTHTIVYWDSRWYRTLNSEKVNQPICQGHLDAILAINNSLGPAAHSSIFRMTERVALNRHEKIPKFQQIPAMPRCEPRLAKNQPSPGHTKHTTHARAALHGAELIRSHPFCALHTHPVKGRSRGGMLSLPAGRMS